MSNPKPPADKAPLPRTSNPPPAVKPLPRPGVGATIYGNLPRDIAADIVRASDFVSLHTSADPSDIASARKVRELGCDRVWLCLPANVFVRIANKSGVSAAVEAARKAARIALDMGAEVLEFNGEGESSGRTPGDWIPADEVEAAMLATLAREIIYGANDVLKGHALTGWTSHDMPSFRLPWGTILGAVDVHSPQHYPAEKGRTVLQRELMSRTARSAGRWEALSEAGKVPADMIPGGARCARYNQGWGHTAEALVWSLSEAPVARVWAYPGSWSPAGLQALLAARVLRADAGGTPDPDTVERFQRKHGLEADGIVGPRTMATLRGVAGTRPGF